MRTLAAAALVAYASADETSLMQERVQRVSLSSDSKSSRQDSTSKLLETAVNMIKSGVTPDVIEFVDSTNAEINDSVLVAIQSEHDIDQAYINSLCAAFETALQNLEDRAADIAGHDSSRIAATEAHHSCRADEAFRCAKSRRCEEQLREKWRIVKREETIMREIHWSIHDEWCVHPPYLAAIPAWLTNDFNWADMSPYPVLQIPDDVIGFRHVSVTHFTSYMEQKIIVEHAWEVYREKLIVCGELETEWEDAIEPCDQAQITMREHACSHALANREAREEFGQEWDRIVRLFNDALIAKTANEQDRKNEWETLKIVQCLLDHVHSEVVTSIQTNGPCPTIDSDPDGVTLAINDCHIVTRGCGPESLTAHLCLVWCEIPDAPPLPPVEEPACTPEYVAREQAQFLAAIQTTYTARLNAPDAEYTDDHLVDYNTVLSPAGWAGCAPPLVCVDCEGLATMLPVPTYDTQADVCHLHEEYLSPGQSNSDSFRCLDGSCVSMAGRCNGVGNCADGSDEVGCDADNHPFVPAYLTQSYDCPADMHPDVHFQCGPTSLRFAALNPRCIDKVGMCNGIDNCGDNSDEAYCSGSIQVTVEATSGRTITVESLQMHSGVFHDREYNFDSLGHFTGKTFIKYSNDDKHTDHEHVMTKIRSVEPLTVFIVKVEGHSLPWLQAAGYERSSYSGVSFSGIRETRHKEWDNSLLTTDHFSASDVWSKTFEAGTISIPGNNGGDGSFLIFLDRPGACDVMTHMMIQGCNNNLQDLEPGCNVADVRCCDMDGSSCNSGYFPQTFTFLDGMVSDGSACADGGCNGVADTWCHSAATFGQAQQICADSGQRLCTRAEIEEDTCCGTGCSHDNHLIWYSDESPPAPHEPIYVGCFVDDAQRDLEAGPMDYGYTSETCAEACRAYQYFSLQNNGWCACGNHYNSEPQYGQVLDGECGAACAGETSGHCGAAWRNAVYTLEGSPPTLAAPVHVTYVGCFVDDENRDLQIGTMNYGYTMETCSRHCRDFNFFALQNNGWCVCGNDYSTEPQYAQVADSECGSPCAGETGGYCGDGWRNAVYGVIRPVDTFPQGLPDFGLFDAGLPLGTEQGLNLNADMTEWTITWGPAGSRYSGRVSPFQATTLPEFDGGPMLRVAWVYPDPQGTQDILNNQGDEYPETQGHRFIRTGGYVYINAAGNIHSVKEIAPTPRPVPADMNPDVVLRWASPPTEITLQQSEAGCAGLFHPITLGALYDGGARHYCWEFSDALIDICPHGCFMYDLVGSRRIVFPIVW